MSGYVSGLVFRHYSANNGKMLIMLALADFADHDGCNIYPSVRLLTEITNASERTVQRHIKSFLDEGLLVLQVQGGGRKRTNKYYIDLDYLRSLPIKTSNKPRQIDTLSGRPINTETPSIRAETPSIGAIKGVIAVTPDPLDPKDPLEDDQLPVDNSNEHADTSKKFRMFLSWKPGGSFAARCKVSGLDLSIIKNFNDSVGEFTSYWSGQDKRLNQNGWEHSLMSNLKRLNAGSVQGVSIRGNKIKLPNWDDDQGLLKAANQLGVSTVGLSSGQLHKKIKNKIEQLGMCK